MSHAHAQAGRTPDGITPVVGYRCWTLVIGLGHEVLQSLNGEIVRGVSLDDPFGQRADPWLVARCLRDDHDAPEESCSCGFYAVKSFSTLGRSLPFVTTRPMSYAGEAEQEAAFPVAGRVDLAGKVIEHDLGYRAERMRITELRAFAGTEQTVTQFARRIGVPVGESIPDPDDGPTSGGSLSGSLARLTPREVQVLRLLASGTTSTEIAAKLSISPLTALRQVRDILAKLQVDSRLAAVARVRRHPPPPDSAA